MSEAPASLGFRPMHRFAVGEAAERVQGSLRTAVESSGYDARWAGEHLLVGHAPSDRKAWSPWLHVDIRPGASGPASGPCEVVARFSPHPALWTGVALSYLTLGSLVLFGACFAWAQHILDDRPWAWWVVGLSVAVAALLWAGSQIGQRLARHQMDELWVVIERAIRAEGD